MVRSSAYLVVLRRRPPSREQAGERLFALPVNRHADGCTCVVTLFWWRVEVMFGKRHGEVEDVVRSWEAVEEISGLGVEFSMSCWILLCRC